MTCRCIPKNILQPESLIMAVNIIILVITAMVLRVLNPILIAY